MAPPRKRTEELQRPRERRGGQVDPISEGSLKPLSDEFTEPDPKWHPIARKIWDGALSSGQKDWYQNSDLAILYSVCEDMSLYKKSSNRSAMMLQTIMSTLSDLLVTEMDRRKARIELQKPTEAEKSYEAIASDFYADLEAEIEQMRTEKEQASV